MSFKNRLSLVFLLTLVCICPFSSSYNYRKQHPSMKYLADPGLFPRLDQLLNRYGSMHTMREYIYWAITEENISNNLRNKFTYVLFEKSLVRQFLKNSLAFNYLFITKYATKLAQIKFNRAKTLNSAKLATEQILKLRRKKMYGLWADSRDMYLSITGLLMFQQNYLWPPAKIIEDNCVDTSYQTRLTLKNTLVIGMCSLFRRTYTFSVEWFEAAERNSRNNIECSNAIDLVIQMRDLSIQEHNKKAGELECWITYDCHMNLFTKSIRYTNEELYLNRIPRRKQLLPKYGRLGTDGTAEDQLINLCSKSVQNILSLRMQAKLKCYYEYTRHAYLYINPVKTEQLSKSPLIFQYYDILGPKLIDELKAHYVENADLLTLLNKIEYYNGKKVRERVDPTPGYVTSITEKYEGHKIFTRFAEIVTGLKFEGLAENLQYMDYTPGRGIKDHEDVKRAIIVNPEKEIDGNSIANALYYLEVPTLGGQTPFCQAGIKAHLVKGSLVIWISKFRNGTNRNDVFHGACPVVHGGKMILAQGLKYLGQENHFKCTLNQFD